MKIKRIELTAAALLLIGVSLPIQASTLYVTGNNGTVGQIFSLNTTTKTASLVETTPIQPDSLIFDPSGRIIYTVYTSNFGGTPQLRIYNPSTMTDTPLATGFSSQLVDLVLDPGGTTLLAADRGNANIDRVNISTGVYSPLGATGSFSGVNGMAYDSSGHLFAVLGSGSDVAQINPTTGAIIKTGSSPTGAFDGLTYDPFSGKLWAAGFSCIYSIDTTTLTPSSCITGVSGADGITTDGIGDLFIASFGTLLVQEYNITSGTFTTVSGVIGGLDDLAPASGLGAPPPPTTGAPEPAAILMTTGGLLALILRRRLIETAHQMAGK